MTAGVLAQEHSLRAFVGGGFSEREVFFHAGDEPRRRIIGYADNVHAYRCARCGAITLPPDGTGESFTCLSCSKLIPAGHTTCPSCGWSYQPAKAGDDTKPKT